jgi:hypothetical protein
MAQTDKWVADLVTELNKKDVKDLEPTYVSPKSGSNLIEPTLIESQEMVERLRAGKTPPEIVGLVKRGQLTFSADQIADAEKAWQGVLAKKTATTVL